MEHTGTDRPPRVGEYETGENNLAIPTDMAITALLTKGVTPSLYINLDTIVRNSIDAFDTARKKSLEPPTVLDIVKRDMDAIAELLPNTVVTYYLPRYQNLPKIFYLMKRRVATTDIQMQRKRLVDTVHIQLGKWIAEEKLNVHYSTSNLLGLPHIEASHLITHHSVDLLRVNKGTILVESNTGNFVESFEFYRKLYNGKKYTTIPFNCLSLCVLGDNADFSPLGADVKGTLIGMSKEFGWTPVTPDKVILYDLQKHDDHLSKDVFTLILKSFR